MARKIDCWTRLSLLLFSMIAVESLTAGEPWEADPALVAKLSASQPLFNYDESRVPKYVLPDPLKLENGTSVQNASQWAARREETIELFRSHVFGRRPKLDCDVRFEVVEEKKDLFGNQATGRLLKVVVTSGNENFSFPMMVFLPSSTPLDSGALEKGKSQPIKKSPAVIHINNREFPSFESACSVEDEFWLVKDIVARGYVACAVSTVAIDPDRANGFSEGLRGFFHRVSGKTEPPAEDAWKALSAWGWGASRALDYLQTCDQVDSSKVALIGHSRGGKSALWAAAEDTRFAVVCSNNSGCGGAALSRRAYGETVARITKSFPHWFCDRFTQYADHESNLPVDQHQLVALMAPRGVYATSASDDLWADPRGEFLSMVAASPVYKLFGNALLSDLPANGTALSDSVLNAVTMPALDEPKVVGKMGYHIRPGIHGLTKYDWMKYLDFCDLQFSQAPK